MRPQLFLALAALALSQATFAQSTRVTVVAVDSVPALQSWLGKPVDPNRAMAPGAYPASLKQVPRGAKVHLPILVSGFAAPTSGSLRLVADVVVLGSDGKTLGSWPQCCQATLPIGSTERAVMLTPTVGMEPDAGNRMGAYTVKVSVTDGTQTWTASETLQYGESSDLPGIANEAPRLRQNLPPERPEGAVGGDKRDCLALATPSDVIKCSERKK